ncbi:hypothetical protein G6W57_08110 [Streptomyces sp. CAI-121]|uniref:hypothetical protein n=1 Tax=unclassified Streptomyces TaxID=2593676 RepID=UPI001587D8E9|nr:MULTISPECIES: hypothetical protein [unclassified Streptomyces]NUV67071.1 hypothetical protein [Streptomyces sp. CAI-121]NUW13189.1 hypothetical protein [Streptomyces sp. CAI-68]
MRLYLGISVILLALLIAASGVAALTRGWVLPTGRKHVIRPRLYGWGQLVIAVALCCQVTFGLMTSGIGSRQWGTLTGSVLMVTGVLVIAMSQRAAGRRQRRSAQ